MTKLYTAWPDTFKGQYQNRQRPHLFYKKIVTFIYLKIVALQCPQAKGIQNIVPAIHNFHISVWFTNICDWPQRIELTITLCELKRKFSTG